MKVNGGSHPNGQGDENGGESERKGRISQDEEDEFKAAWMGMVNRALTAGKDSDFVTRVYERLAAGHGGVEGPKSIRSREARDKFLKDWSDMVEQWERTASEPRVVD